MKSFKFRYSKTVWILLCVVLLLSVSGICWNIFNLFTFINEGAFKTVSYALIILLILLNQNAQQSIYIKNMQDIKKTLVKTHKYIYY